MQSRGEFLSEAVLSSKHLVVRYLVGFNDVTAVRQTPDLPNHLAWSLGHLAHTMGRVAEKLDGKPAFPAEFFVTGDGTRGSKDKGVFDTESVCFNSKPEERHDRFPSLNRATEIFGTAVDRLAAAVKAAPDAKFDEAVQWGQAQTTIGMLVVRMVFHNGFHTGEIADLRRALGFRPIM
ncbi:MAG: DinB family protein [Phycisphaerales bacterium]